MLGGNWNHHKPPIEVESCLWEAKLSSENFDTAAPLASPPFEGSSLSPNSGFFIVITLAMRLSRQASGFSAVFSY